MVADGDAKGYTLLTLMIALIVYWRATTFEQGLSAVIEADGDTDTNVAVAGARFGIGAIPGRSGDLIAEIRAGRTPMESCADRLLGAGGGEGSQASAGAGR